MPNLNLSMKRSYLGKDMPRRLALPGMACLQNDNNDEDDDDDDDRGKKKKELVPE